MKAFVLIFAFFISANAVARDVQPKSFGVQFLTETISGEPFINFTFTINSTDFPSMKFSRIAATLVSSRDLSAAITPAAIIYTKSPSTTILGSEVLMFSYQGALALKVIGSLQSSKVILNTDDGFSFSINLADLCVKRPSAFLNMSGKQGCAVDRVP